MNTLNVCWIPVRKRGRKPLLWWQFLFAMILVIIPEEAVTFSCKFLEIYICLFNKECLKLVVKFGIRRKRSNILHQLIMAYLLLYLLPFEMSKWIIYLIKWHFNVIRLVTFGYIDCWGENLEASDLFQDVVIVLAVGLLESSSGSNDFLFHVEERMLVSWDLNEDC